MHLLIEKHLSKSICVGLGCRLKCGEGVLVYNNKYEVGKI